jgi:hypothetical protein
VSPLGCNKVVVKLDKSCAWSRVQRFKEILAVEKNLGTGRLSENKETEMLVEMIGKSSLLEAVLMVRWEWSRRVLVGDVPC